jgi:hypothetical protein
VGSSYRGRCPDPGPGVTWTRCAGSRTSSRCHTPFGTTKASPRSDRVARLVAGVVVIAVVEDHFEATGYEVQQFVTIWMQLTTVWRRAVHLTNYADREPVNSNRSTRTRHDL